MEISGANGPDFSSDTSKMKMAPGACCEGRGVIKCHKVFQGNSGTERAIPE